MHFFAANAIGPPPRLNGRGGAATEPDLDFTGGRRGNGGMTLPRITRIGADWLPPDPRPSASSAENSGAAYGGALQYGATCQSHPLKCTQENNRLGDSERPFFRTAPGKSGSPAANNRHRDRCSTVLKPALNAYCARAKAPRHFDYHPPQFPADQYIGLCTRIVRRSSREVTGADAFLCDLDPGLCALCVSTPSRRLQLRRAGARVGR